MEKSKLHTLFKDKNFGEILFDEPMKHHTSFKIGGPADVMIVPSREEEIIESIKFCRDNHINHFVMGNGTNLLVKDNGIRGVVIKISNRYDNIEIDEDKVVCQGGALLSVIAKKALRQSLAGFEFASGIPGTIGGAIAMNAGAYGGEMKDIVTEVKVLNRYNNVVEMTNREMNFRYRGSTVIDQGLIVLGVELQLEKGEYSLIEEKMKDFAHRRVSKQPLDLPSGGSTFKRPVGFYAGKLIDDAGLRGIRYRDAQISEKHCGFIVNRGEATFNDVFTLVKTVQKIVYDKFNIMLEPEIKIIGDD